MQIRATKSPGPASDVEPQRCVADINGANGKRSHEVASRRADKGSASGLMVSTSVAWCWGWVRTGGEVLGGGPCSSPSN